MNIIIRVESSNQIGAGHVMRCFALAEELTRRGHEIHFCYTKMLPFLLEKISNLGAGTYLIDEKSGSNEDANQTIALVEKLSAKAIIIDGYDFDENYLAKINFACALVFVDDEAKLAKIDADIIINPSPFAINLPYPSIASKAKLLLGARYAFVRAEFRNKKQNILPLSERHNILVTLGGSDPTNLSAPIVTSLLDCVDENQVIDLVVHNDFNFELPKSVNVYKNSNNMAGLMLKAKLAISAGGGTLGELAVMQVPSLLVITADNQEKHATWAAENQVNKVIDARGVDIKELSSQIARSAYDVLQDETQLNSLIERNKTLVDGNGVDKIVDEITSLGVASK
jgi:UDP-2,4-diacetamido-2,4,6-trideoxy-beta-L-altropyranose hydrolase